MGENSTFATISQLIPETPRTNLFVNGETASLYYARSSSSSGGFSSFSLSRGRRRGGDNNIDFSPLIPLRYSFSKSFLFVDTTS